MRQQSLYDRVQIDYPDEVAYINDRNVIYVSSMTAKPVGARLTFSNGIDSVVLQYDSEQSFIVFNLYDTLKRLVNGQHVAITVTGQLSNDGMAYTITPFAVTVEQGRTIDSHTHHCVRTKYYAGDEELSKVNISVPVGGTAIVGNYTYPLVKGVNKLNLLADQNGDPVTPPSGNFQITVNLSYAHGDKVEYYGDWFNHSDGTLVTSYVVDMIAADACINQNVFAVRFLDTDGCWLDFYGKIGKEEHSITQTNYVRDDIMRHTPRSLVTAVKNEVTAGFEGIADNAYLMDIMYSTDIEVLNGVNSWVKAILSTTKLSQQYKDTNDYEITFTTL